MTSAESSERSRPTWQTLALLCAPAVAVIVFAIGWLLHGTSAAGGQPAGPKGFACIELKRADQPSAGGHCERVVSAMARRSTPDDEQRHQADRTRIAVQHLLADAQVNCGARPAACSATGAPPFTVDAVRQVLASGGYREATVRIARDDDDPAPAGAVLYAVPAGTGCVIGYLGATDLAPNPLVFGTLPDGSCLAD